MKIKNLKHNLEESHARTGRLIEAMIVVAGEQGRKSCDLVICLSCWSGRQFCSAAPTKASPSTKAKSWSVTKVRGRSAMVSEQLPGEPPCKVAVADSFLHNAYSTLRYFSLKCCQPQYRKTSISERLQLTIVSSNEVSQTQTLCERGRD